MGLVELAVGLPMAGVGFLVLQYTREQKRRYQDLAQRVEWVASLQQGTPRTVPLADVMGTVHAGAPVKVPGQEADFIALRRQTLRVLEEKQTVSTKEGGKRVEFKQEKQKMQDDYFQAEQLYMTVNGQPVAVQGAPSVDFLPLKRTQFVPVTERAAATDNERTTLGYEYVEEVLQAQTPVVASGRLEIGPAGATLFPADVGDFPFRVSQDGNRALLIRKANSNVGYVVGGVLIGAGIFVGMSGLLQKDTAKN